MKDSKIILYEADDGSLNVQVRLEDETVWLTLNQIAELFDRDKSTISRHIKNVFETGELSPKSTVAKIATVQKEGEREIERDIDIFLKIAYIYSLIYY